MFWQELVGGMMSSGGTDRIKFPLKWEAKANRVMNKNQSM